MRTPRSILYCKSLPPILVFHIPTLKFFTGKTTNSLRLYWIRLSSALWASSILYWFWSVIPRSGRFVRGILRSSDSRSSVGTYSGLMKNSFQFFWFFFYYTILGFKIPSPSYYDSISDLSWGSRVQPSSPCPISFFLLFGLRTKFNTFPPPLTH